MQDVENYWFDLQCVCLNTPLGTICLYWTRRFPSFLWDSRELELEETRSRLLVFRLSPGGLECPGSSLRKDNGGPQLGGPLALHPIEPTQLRFCLYSFAPSVGIY